MTTQILQAKNGVISDELYRISRIEGVDVEFLRQKIADGRIVILKNKKRDNIVPVAIGENLRIKVNACVGTNEEKLYVDKELDKVRIAQQAGADVLMDLSTGQFIDETRQAIISASKLPLGTVPIYQTLKDTYDFEKNITKIAKDKLFLDIEKQLEDGVDFITLHCGVTRFVMEQLEKQKRISPIVSKAGAMLACYIKMTRKENPLYENFDELLDLVKQYDAVISLGCGLRAGCVADSFDRALSAEIVVLGDLVKRAREAGVQTMIEGVGHTSLDKVSVVINTIKQLTDYAPLHIVGGLACESAIGHDNIASSITSAMAGYMGVDFISSTTPVECLTNPTTADIKDGIICAKIAAHCADIAKQNRLALKMEMECAQARADFDIKKQKANCLDSSVFDNINLSKKSKECNMCGQYCTMKMYKKYLS